MNNNINANAMSDKEYLEDILSSQKYMNTNYNMWAGECVNQNLKDALLEILEDEQQIQMEIFQEISGRGWYSVKNAEQQEVDNVRQKYNNVTL
jgi:spore coat protein CotF